MRDRVGEFVSAIVLRKYLSNTRDNLQIDFVCVTPRDKSVYFLINTCLTGLRSSGILSREVSVFIIIGLSGRC